MEKTQHFSFFQNRKCEFFPCHSDVPEEAFNCLFCYCPLYALGDQCGGGFRYTKDGYKDCGSCQIPHKRENYGHITAKFAEIAKLAAKKDVTE